MNNNQNIIKYFKGYLKRYLIKNYIKSLLINLIFLSFFVLLILNATIYLTDYITNIYLYSAVLLVMSGLIIFYIIIRIISIWRRYRTLKSEILYFETKNFEHFKDDISNVLHINHTDIDSDIGKLLFEEHIKQTYNNFVQNQHKIIKYKISINKKLLILVTVITIIFNYNVNIDDFKRYFTLLPIKMKQMITDSDKLREMLGEKLIYSLKTRKEYPYIGDITVAYKYPEYTGLGNIEDITSLGHIKALERSDIYIQCKTNKRIKEGKILISNGIEIPIQHSDTNELSIEFNLNIKDFSDTEYTYYWKIRDFDDLENQDPITYKINIERDILPMIKILSPTDKIRINKDGSVNIVLFIDDDYGIKELRYHYRINDSKWNSKKVNIKQGFVSGYLDYEIDINKMGLNSKDNILYYFSVLDNNNYNKNRVMSDTRSIYVIDYKIIHKDIKRFQKVLADHMVEVSGKQYEMMKKMEKLSEKSEKGLEPGDDLNKMYDELSKKYKELDKNVSKTTNDIDKLSNMMENDPLSDFNSMLELQEMQKMMKYFTQDKMKKVAQSIEQLKTETKFRKQSGVSQDKILKNQKDIIKRMTKKQKDLSGQFKELSKWSKQIADSKKYKNIQERSKDLMVSNKNFLQKLQDLKNSQNVQGQKGKQGKQKEEKSEKIKEMQEMLQDMKRQLNELQNQLQRFAKRIPPSMMKDYETVDMNDIQRQMNSINSSLESGDIETAEQQAKRMMEQMNRMMQALKNQGNEKMMSKINSMINKGMEKLKKQLNYIIKEELNIFRTVVYSEKKYLNIINLTQVGIIEKQDEVLGEVYQYFMVTFQSYIGSNILNRAYHGLMNIYQRDLIKNINIVRNEFKNKKLLYSPGKIDNIIKDIDQFIAVIQKNNDALINKKKIVPAENKKKLVELSEYKRVLQKIYSSITPDNDKMIELALNRRELMKIHKDSFWQSLVRNKTKTLIKDATDYFRRTLALDPKIIVNLQKAAEYMKFAVKNMDFVNLSSAKIDVKNALYYLYQAENDMKKNQQQMMQQQQQQSQGTSSAPMIFSNQFMPQPMQRKMQNKKGYGVQGTIFDGPVKLPEAKEYEIPKEFSDELLDAIRRGQYPKIYEKEIKDYYHKLTK